MLKREGEEMVNKTGRMVLRILGGFLTLALMVVACAALILSRPDPADSTSPATQPPLAASPALTVESEKDLRDLVAAFPISVMSFMSGSGQLFVSASSGDIAMNGGFGRIASLSWQTPSGEPILLQSVYPASGLSLLEAGDYHFVRIAGPSLFGVTSVRMENADTIRLHATTDSGLYIVTVPKALSENLSVLCRSIQLFTAE